MEIPHLETVGTLLEAPRGKKRVWIRVGGKDLSVATSLLVGRTRQKTYEQGSDVSDSVTLPHPSKFLASDSSSVEKALTAPSVLDLRGKMVDEALDQTMAILDQAALVGPSSVCIIHGHGTGKLKTAVRDYLATSPYVVTFRPGERGEGGDGVTVVELK